MQTATAERRKIVTKIPADPAKAARFDPNRPLRVAAYCRVSTDLDDQLNSYETQKAYYTEYIRKNPKWRFAGIYADEGISGTQVKKRESFLRMISDCENGKIDLILIKSVSRYARKIVDCISYIRILKSRGIAIYFEEQNINTLTEDSETYIGIYGVLAQAESENISANIKWAIRKRMESGSYNCNFNLLGYRRDKLTKEIVIIPEEAEAVKKIYSLYIQGNTLEQIKEYLESRQIKTSRGKYEWSKAGIKAILTNEKYVGDSLLGKTYTTLTLPHRKIENKGEGVQYFIEGSHPPIVSRTVFDKAQQLLSRKSAAIPPRAAAPHPLSRKIVCGHCGAFCKRKKTRGTAYWICQTHNKNAGSCPTMQIPETEITEAFLRIYFTLKHHGDQVLTRLIQDLQAAKNGKLLWSEDIVELNKQIADIACQERLLAQLKQQAVVDPDIFIFQSNQLAEQRREAKLKKSRILRSEDDQTVQRTQELLDILEDGPDLLTTFDEALFSELVETITIQDNSIIRFRLINGLELPEHIERKK